jgi:hypothetical protein
MWSKDQGHIFYLLSPNLQWMYVEVDHKLCNISYGNKTKALSCCSCVFMNWNDLVEGYNGIDNDMCIACCTNICCAFKNVVPIFLICSNVFVVHVYIFLKLIAFLSGWHMASIANVFEARCPHRNIELANNLQWYKFLKHVHEAYIFMKANEHANIMSCM